MKQAFTLVKPFFKANPKYAYGGATLLLAFSAGIVGLTAAFNTWRGAFYNAIQEYDVTAFWHQFGIFCILAAVAILVYTLQTYTLQIYTLKWRLWYTNHLIVEWHHKTQLSGTNGQVENADQRIQEDVRLLTRLVADLGTGIVGAVATIVVFTPVLFDLSTHVVFFGYYISGSLWYLSTFFAVFGSLFCFWIGRRVPAMQYSNQAVEASFRYTLVEKRQKKEGVGVGHLEDCLHWVNSNYRQLFKRYKLFNLSSNTYYQCAIIVPFLVAAPSYFAHLLTLGLLMQIAHAFGVINDSMTYLLNRYLDLAELRSAVTRLYEFEQTLK